MDKVIHRAISAADRARHATRAQAITPSMYMPYRIPRGKDDAGAGPPGIVSPNQRQCEPVPPMSRTLPHGQKVHGADGRRRK